MSRAMRRRPARTGALLAVAVAALLVLAGCGHDSRNAAAVRSDGSIDLSKVTLVVGDQKGGTQSLLTAAGLTDTPYQVQYQQFTSGPPLMEALNAGSLDAGIVGNTPPVFSAAAGGRFKVVQAASYGGRGDQILVPKGSSITSVADLRGHSVAVAQGSSANYHLIAQLKAAGLATTDVSLQYLQPPDALAAFSSGHVDAWAIWQPYVAQAVADTGAHAIANGQDLTNGYNFEVASDQALGDPATSAALSDFVGRIARAQVWSGQHPDAWAAAWAQATGLPEAVTRAAVADRVVTTLPVDQTVIDSEQQMADTFSDAGLIPDHLDVGGWFSGQFNDVTSPREASAASSPTPTR